MTSTGNSFSSTASGLLKISYFYFFEGICNYYASYRHLVKQTGNTAIKLSMHECEKHTCEKSFIENDPSPGSKTFSDVYFVLSRVQQLFSCQNNLFLDI